MLWNCGVGTDPWESVGLQGDPTIHPKGNQSWIFVGRTDGKVDTPMLWPPDAKSWFIWKDLMLGKIEGRKRRGRQMMRWLYGIINSVDMSLSSGRCWWTGRPDVLQYLRSQRVRHNWATELNWTTTYWGSDMHQELIYHIACFNINKIYISYYSPIL